MPANQHELAAGFYWVKSTCHGRWEVAEYDGVSWNIDPLYLIGSMIPEPLN